MKYYVVNPVLQGIQYLSLKPGTDVTGQIAYYINLEKPSDFGEECPKYFNSDCVFEDYDDALAYFCNKCAQKIEALKRELQQIIEIKNRVLES